MYKATVKWQGPEADRLSHCHREATQQQLDNWYNSHLGLISYSLVLETPTLVLKEYIFDTEEHARAADLSLETIAATGIIKDLAGVEADMARLGTIRTVEFAPTY